MTLFLPSITATLPPSPTLSRLSPFNKGISRPGVEFCQGNWLGIVIYNYSFIISINLIRAYKSVQLNKLKAWSINFAIITEFHPTIQRCMCHLSLAAFEGIFFARYTVRSGSLADKRGRSSRAKADCSAVTAHVVIPCCLPWCFCFFLVCQLKNQISLYTHYRL